MAQTFKHNCCGACTRLSQDHVRAVCAQILKHGARAVPHETMMEPGMSKFEGAIMICDVTGFTKLTEALSKKGTAGVELLTKCMNNYFSSVRHDCCQWLCRFALGT